MTAALPAMLGVMAVIVAAMALGTRLLRRPGIPPEAPRKLVHVAAGAVSLPFPWIFSGPGPVLALCAASIALLVGLRWVPPLHRLLGGSVHAVDRRSIGDMLLPLAIAALFLLRQGNPVLFVAPVAVMALADGAAALVGLRYGLSPYTTTEGSKSWEGSVTFFLLAVIGTLVPLLLLTDVGHAEMLLIALLVGVIGCAIEASAWYGLDNLLVPLGVYALLQNYLDRDAAQLLRELGVIAFVVLVLLLWSRRLLLDAQARFTTLLAGYFFSIVGGASWMTPGVAVYVLSSLIVPVPEAARRPVHLWAIIAVVASGLPWLAAMRLGLLASDRAYLGICTTFAAQLCFIWLMRHHIVAGASASARDVLEWSFVAAGGLAVAFFLHVPQPEAAMSTLAVGMPALTALVLGWQRLGLATADPGQRLWIAEIAATLCFGGLVLVVLQILGTLP